MKTCAIVGINWGDEGKGRMVDLVAEEYDIVVRYQGGNNAGHTIKNDYGTFALNLLPSGIFSATAPLSTSATSAAKSNGCTMQASISPRKTL